MNIVSLFPTPLYQNSISTKVEYEDIFQSLGFLENTGGNFFTQHQNVLELECFVELKNEILKNIDSYFKNIIDSSKTIQPYITNSWVNVSTTGNTHHKHSHNNSLISGVTYLYIEDSSDSIVFYNDRYSHIKIYPNNYNFYNSDSWRVPVKTNDILLFPSYLNHGVDECKTNKRISLAFNVFFKGDIGENYFSNSLNIG
jgi:uncharacterized protein (TIGR02466 family)